MTLNCDRCGRELKTPKSQLLGMGPVCKRKAKAEAEEKAKQQEAEGIE